MGNVKKEDFDEFSKGFLPKEEINIDKTIENLKKFNVPIEEN